MIFRQWRQVLDGTKTQTRRLWREGDYTWITPELGAVEPPFVRILEVSRHDSQDHHRLRWAVGRDYAVQPGRTKKSLGRIKILEIRRENLQDITVKDVEAEGIDVVRHMPLIVPPGTTEERLDALALRVAHGLFEALWDSINTKKGTRWADNPIVWVLAFEFVAGEGR